VATFGAIISDIMVNELRAVVHELGGERTLGRTLSNDRDLRDAIREGFPPAVVAELMRASGLTLKELAAALDLSPRSLQRRRSKGRLARYESDRLYRLARIVALANEYLGDHVRALRWLKHPNRALGGIARSRQLTRNWARVRSKTFWVASRTAALVEACVPGVAQELCGHPIRWRGFLPFWRALV